LRLFLSIGEFFDNCEFISRYCFLHSQKKRYKSCHWGGTNMHPLGTKVYLLKRYHPSDSFYTFLSEIVFLYLKILRILRLFIFHIFQCYLL